jgi:glutamine amidotransferase
VSDDVIIIGSSGANLASLGFALRRLGVDAPVTEDPARVTAAKRVILPGVGAAADAMERLQAAGLSELIPELEQPVLGICLGMQLLFNGSEEDDAACLGIIDADVKRLPSLPELPVPEMGWNELENLADSRLLDGIDGGYAYFVHSYAAPVGPYTRATANYGRDFSAVVQQANFAGTQFHPERSARLGARILKNFLSL